MNWPSMEETRKLPLNGLKCVSTFSGCGGSSLGLRQAGFKVLLANEFVPAAREVYELNHLETPVLPHDIRQITADEILDRTGLAPGELDLLEGSPPCSSFSTSGKRHNLWGEVKKYSDTEQRTDDLFFEFLRLVEGLRPRAVVAENVVGMTIGRAKGFQKVVFDQLDLLGYRTQSQILAAHRLGVAQRRERMIIVAVRNDQPVNPCFPFPRPETTTLADALAGLGDPGEYKELLPGTKMRKVYDVSLPGESMDKTLKRIGAGGRDRYFTHHRAQWDKPINTVTASACTIYHPDVPRTLGINELRRCSGFPDDFILTGSFTKQWERLGRAVMPPVMRAVGEQIAKALLEVA